MMEMDEARWRATRGYLNEVFGREDERRRQILERSAAAGLPPIAVDAAVGRFLALLVRLTRGARALEVGTLAGYSATWIAEGLAPGGRLITIERDAVHARIARESFDGLEDRIELRLGEAFEALDAIERPLDFVFLDADKTEYEGYFERVADKLSSGGLLVADNVIGSRFWWIDSVGHPDRDAVDRFNRRVAADPRFDCAGLSMREGLLVARRR